MKPPRTLPLVMPPLLWLAHFTAVYAWASLACAAALPGGVPPGPLIFWGTGALTVVAVAAAIAGAVRHARRWRRGGADDLPVFIAGTGAWLYALAALSMLWVALPGLVLPGCA